MRGIISNCERSFAGQLGDQIMVLLLPVYLSDILSYPDVMGKQSALVYPLRSEKIWERFLSPAYMNLSGLFSSPLPPSPSGRSCTKAPSVYIKQPS